MSSVPTPKPHHPLFVGLAVVCVALPATVLTWLVNSIGKNGPAYSLLHLGVLAVASVTGIGAYLLQLRIDPNVPKLALFPAILASFIMSVFAFVGALVWFVN